MKTIVGGVCLSILFAFIALEGRSVLLLVALIAILVFFSFRFERLPHLFGEIFSGPYLPFVLCALVLTPFQANASEALWLLSIPLSYALARLLRKVATPVQIALAVGLLGLCLGTVLVLGRSEAGDQLGPVQDLAFYLHKNVFGWIIALGTVALLTLVLRWPGTSVRKIALVSLGATSGTLVFLSGSMTGFLGAAIVLSVVSGLALVRSLVRKSPYRSRPWDFAVLGLGSLMGLVFVVVNLVDTNQRLSDLAGREKTLTGRTSLWSCYVEGTLDPRLSAAEVRRACIFGHGNLHNSFLEAHNIGGLLLAGALLFGFFAATLQSGRKFWNATNDLDMFKARLALAVTLLGFSIAMVESFIFSRHVYVSIVLFLGPAIQRPSAYLDWVGLETPRFLRRGRAKTLRKESNTGLS